MSRRAVVSQAAIKRTVRALEAVGKTVTGAVLRPDGSWEVRLTESDGTLSPTDPLDAELAQWAERHGYG